jgi:hypothetical protein
VTAHTGFKNQTESGPGLTPTLSTSLLLRIVGVNPGASGLVVWTMKDDLSSLDSGNIAVLENIDGDCAALAG